MMTCKDCMYCDVCHYTICFEEEDSNIQMQCSDKVEKYCKHFKDKSRFIELPCKVGDTIYRCGDPIKKVYEWEIEHVELYLDEIVFVDDSDTEFTAEDIGKTVFLTTSCGSLLVPRKIGKGVKFGRTVSQCPACGHIAYKCFFK